MEFRYFPKGGERISTIGLGGSKLHLVSEDELANIVTTSQYYGITCIDLATETNDVFLSMGRVLVGRRGEFMLGFHLGLTFQEDGQYRGTRNRDDVKRAFSDTLLAHH